MVKGERAEFPPLPVMHKWLKCLTPCFGNRSANAVVMSSQRRPDFFVQNILQSNDTPKRPKMNLCAYAWHWVCHSQAYHVLLVSMHDNDVCVGLSKDPSEAFCSEPVCVCICVCLSVSCFAQMVWDEQVTIYPPTYIYAHAHMNTCHMLMSNQLHAKAIRN